ncbi:MFS monosaccharide transporter [Gautieria morchelliformis]|nr:MFS monosaccharide transporter [Gautieria morchelliformis]
MPGGPVASGNAIGANAPKNKWAGILMTAFAAFGGILYGYDTGTISGIIVMNDWLCTFGGPVVNPAAGAAPCAISTSQQSLVVSILSLGTIFGALAAAPVADRAGRRMGIIVSCIVFSAGVALQTASTTMPLFVVGRVVAGLGVGLVSCIVPMYQSECSPKWIRGAVVSCYQWAITIGLLLASVVNNATQGRNDHSSYRLPIAIQFVWAMVLAVGMFLLPESPRYLMKRGRDAAAAKSLSRLTGVDATHPSIESDLGEIRRNLKHEEEIGQATYADCFRSGGNRILLRTLTGIFLQAWQQLTGINFIFYYGTTFFKNSHVGNPFMQSVITNVVNVGMSIPGIYFVDKVGRRSLLLIGASGMMMCEYIVAIAGVTIPADNIAGQKVLVAFVCIYIAFFAATWGPIPWVVTGEIFPRKVRAKAMSFSTASNWFWNLVLGFVTPYLVNPGKGNANLGAKVFFIWGSTCLGCLLFTYFCIPETKGLALEQIDIMYMNTTPRKSIAYRNQMFAHGIGGEAAYGKEDSQTTEVYGQDEKE